MAEGARQEIEIEFGGKAFSLRPDFATLVSLETALGQPSRTLGMKMLNFEISVSEIAAVLFVLLKDKKDAPKREEIGPTLVEDGYNDLMLPLGQFLTRAVRGNKEHEREATEAAKAAAAGGGDGPLEKQQAGD